MVACKMFNENHSNQRKLKLIYLEEQAAPAALLQSSSSTATRKSIQRKPLGHATLFELAKANQKQQAKKTKPQATTWGKRGKDKKLDNSLATFATKSKENRFETWSVPSNQSGEEAEDALF